MTKPHIYKKGGYWRCIYNDVNSVVVFPQWVDNPLTAAYWFCLRAHAQKLAQSSEVGADTVFI